MVWSSKTYQMCPNYRKYSSFGGVRVSWVFEFLGCSSFLVNDKDFKIAWCSSFMGVRVSRGKTVAVELENFFSNRLMATCGVNLSVQSFLKLFQKTIKVNMRKLSLFDRCGARQSRGAESTGTENSGVDLILNQSSEYMC